MEKGVLMIKIYLCSRVHEEARPMNNEVALALIKAGFDVYIPHTAPHNNMAGSTDFEIYTQDLTEMKKADICVAVGRLGNDCCWELGFFTGVQKLCYWYLPQPEVQGRSPMLYEMKPHTFQTIKQLVDTIKDEMGG
jgi:nucleoside 2-deoxyribosyltransferase